MKKTNRLTLTALFVALVFLLGLTPLGLIPLGFINVTILCIPVIVGALLLGWQTGLLLGFFFGTASLMSVMGLSMTAPSGLASALLAQSVPLCVIMCYVPRLCVPLVACGVYRLIARGQEHSVKALPFAAAAGSLTNTLLDLGMMWAFYALTGLDANRILALILGTGALGGGSEAVVAAVLVTPIVTALWKVFKR